MRIIQGFLETSSKTSIQNHRLIHHLWNGRGFIQLWSFNKSIGLSHCVSCFLIIFLAVDFPCFWRIHLIFMRPGLQKIGHKRPSCLSVFQIWYKSPSQTHRLKLKLHLGEQEKIRLILHWLLPPKLFTKLTKRPWRNIYSFPFCRRRVTKNRHYHL